MTPSQIRTAALILVDNYGLINLDRAELCRELGISPGSFHHIMGCNFGEFVESLRKEGITGPDNADATKYRTSPELRRASILRSAMNAAQSIGYDKITRKDVALAARVSPGLVTKYFVTIGTLQVAVLRAAITEGDAAIIAQGLAARDPLVLGAPEEVKKLGAQYLAEL